MWIDRSKVGQSSAIVLEKCPAAALQLQHRVQAERLARYAAATGSEPSMFQTARDERLDQIGEERVEVRIVVRDGHPVVGESSCFRSFLQVMIQLGQRLRLFV